jgi:hypothetical protein
MSTLNPARRLAANLATLSASRWLPYALFAGLVTMWAYNYVVMKVTLQAATPITHLIIRTTIGSLTLFGVLLARGLGLKPQRLKQTLQVGLTTTFAYGLTVTLALGRCPRAPGAKPPCRSGGAAVALAAGGAVHQRAPGARRRLAGR